jgi:hypothetical protein
MTPLAKLGYSYKEKEKSKSLFLWLEKIFFFPSNFFSANTPYFRVCQRTLFHKYQKLHTKCNLLFSEINFCSLLCWQECFISSTYNWYKLYCAANVAFNFFAVCSKTGGKMTYKKGF